MQVRTQNEKIMLFLNVFCNALPLTKVLLHNTSGVDKAIKPSALILLIIHF